MFPEHWHRNIFLFGLISLAVGMLFGNALTSIPLIILITNWLLEKNFNTKWINIKSTKIFWLLISLYLLHIIGMAHTTNVSNGIHDLKTKLPFLLLPVILFSSKPLSLKEIKLLFGFFLTSVLVSSLYCYLVYTGATNKTIIDTRNASVFISHIRFSLFISFSVFCFIYLLINTHKLVLKICYFIATLWLVYFLNKLEMATGMVFLISVFIILLLAYAIKKLNKIFTYSLVLILICVSGLIFNAAKKSISMYEKIQNSVYNKPLTKTKSGNYYYHDTSIKASENGTLIGINISEYELKKEWNKKSNYKVNGHDKKGNLLYFTLLRYLASKGFTKDSVGISRLTNSDVSQIENGISNYRYGINSGLFAKWREVVWEYTKYKNGDNPSGHSIMMRLEFWKTACYIISEHVFFGVGTGDIQDSFNDMYIKSNSKLDLAWRLRCHNQYLAITVAFGVFGLLIFLTSIISPAILLKNKLHYLYWPFFLIALLSFITEDTLETQTGVTFFVFFQTLFIWMANYKTTETK